MSFLAGLGFTSEKPPIVIEFGSRYTKAGFGGEPGPRVIVATPEQLRSPSAQVETVSSFMLWLYNVHLQISPRERRIAIVEKSTEPEHFRERVAEAALKYIAAPGLIFITRPVAAVTGCGIASNTGLVINLGWSEFTVATVVHGVPLIWNEKTTEQSIEQMSMYLRKTVLATNESINEELFPLKYAEDVLARLAYCVGIEDEWNQKQREKVEELETDGVNVVNVKRGQVMDTVDLMWIKYAENNRLSTLGKSKKVSIQLNSFDSVLDALLEAPIDSRRALAGNIILCGGGASMPGLNRRLLQEINHQLAEERYEKLANLDVSFDDFYFF